MNIMLLRRTAATGAMFLLGCLASPAQNAGQQLYGITFFSNQLISVDPATGQGAVVGALSTNLSAYGIAARYGRLYTFNPNTDRIVEIDPATAQVRQSINIGVSGLQGEGDLAIRNDGIGFLTSALNTNADVVNDFYTFDLAAGTSQRIASSSISIDALAFDTNNVLYALGQDDVNLYTVNQTSGAVTLVGALGVNLSSPFAGMTFGPDGTLYAAINDQLYTVNKATGAAIAASTNVLDFGYSSVSGLAFQTPQPPTHLVGITYFGNQLFSVNPTDGSGSLIGNLNGNVSGYGIAAYASNLYTFNPNVNEIQLINPTSGAAGPIISIGVANLQGEGDLAFRADGQGFLASALTPQGDVANDFYAFNVTTGVSQRLGTTTVPLDALAFDTNNVLYALGQDDVNLYTVSQSNGALTNVGPLGVNMSSPFAGMTFGPDGTLYAAINDQLYTIDKTSGAATAVSTSVLDFGFSSVSGLAFAPTAAQLSFVRELNGLTLYWSGTGYTLLSSTNAAGPYTVAALQGNPERIPTDSRQMFFRLQR